MKYCIANYYIYTYYVLFTAIVLSIYTPCTSLANPNPKTKLNTKKEKKQNREILTRLKI